MEFETLTQVALLGTERQALPAFQSGSTLGDLLVRTAVPQQEQSLLRAAAATAQHERAGRVPPQVRSPEGATSKPEPLPRAGARASTHLMSLLGGDHPALLPEWLRLCAQTAHVAPPESTPLLLSLGEAKPGLRAAILPVLGERGRWLAPQQAGWSWVIGETADEGVWQTGDPAARLTFLKRTRETAPGEARNLLASTWAREEPEQRAEFIQVLAVNLGLEDEPFLEKALDDKRKEVRRRAADLLARLPESALVKRMKERLAPVLQYQRAEAGSLLKLKKGHKAALKVNLPEECSKDMQRDGIEPKPPGKEMGEKAWWVAQMIGCVPTSFWRVHWQCSPDELHETVKSCEFKKVLWHGLAEACIRHREAEQAESFFSEDPGLVTPNLWSVIPTARREYHLSRWLESPHGFGTELLFESLHAWSPEFSRSVLKWMRALCSQDSMEWQLRNRFKELAAHLAPDSLGDAAQNWPTGAKNWEFWSKGVDEFLVVAQFRQEMRKALLEPV